MKKSGYELSEVIWSVEWSVSMTEDVDQDEKSKKKSILVKGHWVHFVDNEEYIEKEGIQRVKCDGV